MSRAEYLASQQKFAEANRDLRAILALDRQESAGTSSNWPTIAAQQGQDQNVRSILAQAIAVARQMRRAAIALVRYLM